MRVQTWQWVIILAIVLLLWGAPKLPGLAKSVGQSIKIFKKEVTKDGGASSANDEAGESEKKQD